MRDGFASAQQEAAHYFDIRFRHKKGISKLCLSPWQGRRDSNTQPAVLETAALPIEPLPFVLNCNLQSRTIYIIIYLEMFVKKFLAICKKRGQVMIPTENIQNKYTRAQAQADYKEVSIYTDGACSGNPGPGGWGAVLIYRGQEKELSGYYSESTNNRMELTAALKALQALKVPCRVKLYTDSAYLCNGFNSGWTMAWERNGWINSKKKPVENQDLWMALVNETKMHNVEWIKVKGHADNAYNNRCDKLATDQIKRHKAE